MTAPWSATLPAPPSTWAQFPHRHRVLRQPRGRRGLRRARYPRASTDLRLRYAGFVDPSGGSQDSFTLAVAHRDLSRPKLSSMRCARCGRRFRRGTVVAEFAATLRSYRVTKVSGDRYAGEWPREQFRKFGITYEVAAKPKSDLFRDLLPMLKFPQGRIARPSETGVTAESDWSAARPDPDGTASTTRRAPRRCRECRCRGAAGCSRCAQAPHVFWFLWLRWRSDHLARSGDRGSDRPTYWRADRAHAHPCRYHPRSTSSRCEREILIQEEGYHGNSES